jgi:hypothetical protein
MIDSTAGCDLLSFLDAYSGYHVTSQDFIKFWGNFFCFCFECIDWNSQGFKTFELYKSYILKTISNSLIFHEEPYLRKPSIKMLFSFSYSNLCKLAYKGMKFKSVYKIGISKLWLSVVFNYYFINYYYITLKGINFKTLFHISCMQAKPFWLN